MSQWSEREEFDCQIVEGDTLTLRLVGDLDATASSEFQEQLGICGAEEQKKVFVDCTSLRYIGSDGLGVLATLHSHICRKGGVLKLFALQPQIAEILGVMQLDKLFAIYPDAAAAGQSL